MIINKSKYEYNEYDILYTILRHYKYEQKYFKSRKRVFHFNLLCVFLLNFKRGNL